MSRRRRRRKKTTKAVVEKVSAPENKKSKLREYFESLIVAIILALFVKTFALQTFQIPTGSMEDGLLVGDHIIVNKLVYGPEMPLLSSIMPMRDVQRGDVIIFKYPDNPRIDYVKRIIGLPGEEVRIDGAQLTIDGTPIEELGMDEDSYTLQWRNPDEERVRAIERYTDEEIKDLELRRQMMESEHLRFKVPEGHYFVMGDHRASSEDSRRWRVRKFVPRESIIGRAVMIYWSYKTSPEAYKETNFGAQVGNFLRAVVTFPFNTRWGRLFNIVS
jgi:signal peptidase I